MNKKIKIIELLNKIANGEEVPKSIKYVDNILKYDESIQEYIGLPITGAGAFFNYLFVNKPTLSFINEEVDIVEEDKLIEPIVMSVILDDYSNNNETKLAKKVHNCESKINELIDAVNKMKGDKE